MDFAGSKDDDYLTKYYAGQAMNGLLANLGVSQSLSPSHELGANEKAADELAELAYEIADAMVQETTKRFQQ